LACLQCDKIKLQVIPIENEKIETNRLPLSTQGCIQRFSEVLPIILSLKKTSLEKTELKSGYWIVLLMVKKLDYSKGTFKQWVEKIERKLFEKRGGMCKQLITLDSSNISQNC
jgi:hypothetical protein